MRIFFKQIKGQHVETRSGEQLGYLKDVVLDTEGQLVVQYIVKPHLWPGEELLVSRDQIVSITAQKIIVEDGTAQLEKEKRKRGTLGISPDPIAMQTE